jgi:hypothetical protein
MALCHPRRACAPAGLARWPGRFARPIAAPAAAPRRAACAQRRQAVPSTESLLEQGFTYSEQATLKDAHAEIDRQWPPVQGTDDEMRNWLAKFIVKANNPEASGKLAAPEDGVCYVIKTSSAGLMGSGGRIMMGCRVGGGGG